MSIAVSFEANFQNNPSVAATNQWGKPMDDSQFDRMTREIAQGTSRRTLIKSLVGIGGVAVAGNWIRTNHAEAARRGFAGPTLPAPPTVQPTSTATPSCPSGQSWDGSGCACDVGITCGTACCGANFFCSSDIICRPNCFVGDTRIAMADGTSRPIAGIVSGDLVLGDDGRINRVVSNDHHMLGDRPLYGFNGSAPFVTASHPFMTDDGWKAVDPTFTFSEHHLPAVQRLQVGDRLVLLTGVLAHVTLGSPLTSTATPLEIETGSISLESLNGSAAPASTPLFNLRLDGNHTYFANELLVHNKI